MINKKRDPILIKIKNLVSVLESPFVSKRKRPEAQPLWLVLLMVGDTRFELVTPSV